MVFKKSTLGLAVVSAVLFASGAHAEGENTLDKVKKAGVLSCGVSTGLPVFLTRMLKANGKASM